MSIRDTYTEDVEYVRSILDELAESATDREFTEDEQSHWDEGRAFVTETVAKIEAIDAREAQRAELAALAIAKPERQERAVPEAVNVNTRTSPWEDVKSPSERGYHGDVRARAIDAIERADHFLSDDHREAATRAVERVGQNSNESPEQIARAREIVLWGSSRHYNAAFAKRGDEAFNRSDVSLDAKEAEAYERANAAFRGSGFFDPVDTNEARAFALTNVTGVLVPAHLDPSIILTTDGALNPYREISRVVPVSTNVWTGVSSAGISGGWTGSEASEVDDDTPTQSSPSVTCYMADAFVPFSFQAWEDWSGAEAELMVMFADYKSTLEESAHTKGSGSAQPFGIVTALKGTTSHVSCNTNSSFTSADLFSVKQALPARWKGRARYVMNEAYNDRIRQFGTNDGSLYTVDLTEENAVKVLGKRAHLSTTMSSALSSVTNTVLIYGDWSQYLIADRIGMAVEFIPNLFHTNANRPSASRGVLMHWRTGSDSIVDSAFRMLVNQGAH